MSRTEHTTPPSAGQFPEFFCGAFLREGFVRIRGSTGRLGRERSTFLKLSLEG